MAPALHVTFARWCREARTDLDITQSELAAAVGVSRALIAGYETGRVVPRLDVVDRIGAVLGVEFALSAPRPIVLGGRIERDLVHARCSGYVGRRLAASGLLVARELEIVDGRSHGWIDLLAIEQRTGRLFIVEIKTSLDDVGEIERQLGWYERLAVGRARELGWQPTEVTTWLLLLATEETDVAVARQRDVLDVAFPVRAMGMRQILAGDQLPEGRSGRGLALIDPTRRRREWLIPTRLEGRRTNPPFRDRGDAARRMMNRGTRCQPR